MPMALYQSKYKIVFVTDYRNNSMTYYLVKSKMSGMVDTGSLSGFLRVLLSQILLVDLHYCHVASGNYYNHFK